VEAYENLATLYIQQDQPERAETIMARAVLVSPRSQRRQLQYARLCERNSHYDAAALAWRDLIRIVRHSRHEGPEHHLALARNLSDFCELRNAFADERLSGEAFKAIEFLRAKYRPYGDSLLQSLLIEGRLHQGKGNLEQGKLCLREANALFAEAPAVYSPESRLEYAKSLSRTGDNEQARTLLAEVMAEDGLYPALLARADKVLEEPVSQGGKRKIIELNQQGIRCFKAEEYRAARDAFALAHARFPRNVELNLNLLQALIRLIHHSEDSREREDWLGEAENCLHLIGELAREHPKFETYRRLLQEIQELQRR
jgi:tetratricopeptide (TPR) repeat protein